MQQDIYPLKAVLGLTSSSVSLLWASYILTAFAIITMLVSRLNILLMAILLCSAVQHYLFIRVQFDRQLLKQLIEEHTYLDDQTQQLDQALLRLGLIKAAKTNRPWSQRLTGILRLFKLQGVFLLLNFLLLITVLVIGVR